MHSVRITLLAGLALLAIAIVLTLSQSPVSVAGTNKVPNNEASIGSTTRSATYCQAHEAIPGGVSAIRLWLDAAAGPRVSVVVSAGGRVITRGSRGSAWIGGSVTIPVKPPPQTVSSATVCASFQLLDETVVVQGSAAPATLAVSQNGAPLNGRMRIEYLHPGANSWLSLALQVARRMGLGRAAAGTWITLVALALLAAVTVLASRLVLKEIG